ncbi:MAG: hypothetical protein ACLULM_09580 [Acutalibacter sp.]
MLRRVLKRAGLPYVRFHDLRHLRHPGPAKRGGRENRLFHSGHFSAGFTLDTYAHVTTTAQQEAAKKMDGVLGQQLL